jgi:hypothetical protein
MMPLRVRHSDLTAPMGDFMKKAVFAAAAAAFACVTAPAHAATTVWQGDLFITAVSNTASCNAVNMTVGDFARGVFRPKSVAGNGTADLLAWFFSRSSHQLAPTGNLLNGATAVTLRTIFGSAGFLQFTNWTVSGVVVSPAAPAAATKTVSIQITVHDIYSSSTSAHSGCDVTMKGILAKKP